MNNTSKLFFTSDTHFGHENIMKYSNRPFRDVNHMNEELIKNWNALISEDDEVYHLGDFAFGTTPEKTSPILDRLNGRIYLVAGNHERCITSSSYNRDRFEWIRDKYVLRFKENGEKYMITLAHCAGRVWFSSHGGSWMLYGHSHDSLDFNKKTGKLTEWGKSMDCGVDTAYRLLGEYRPFRFNEIKNILDKREIEVVDHHGNRERT